MNPPPDKMTAAKAGWRTARPEDFRGSAVAVHITGRWQLGFLH
jgi:hypothetical protein